MLITYFLMGIMFHLGAVLNDKVSGYYGTLPRDMNFVKDGLFVLSGGLIWPITLAAKIIFRPIEKIDFDG